MLPVVLVQTAAGMLAALGRLLALWNRGIADPEALTGLVAAFLLITFNLKMVFFASWGGVVLGHSLAAAIAVADFAL